MTKQSISNLEIMQEAPKQRLNCIATENGMITIRYSLCCLLSVLYEITPGYLMGQSDDRNRDVYVHKYVYFKKGEMYQNENGSSDITASSMHEEYEVSPGLIIPIKMFSKKKREGRIAADRMREYSGLSDTDFQSLLAICEKIYYQPIPVGLKKDLRLLFDGLLDDSQIVRRCGDL